MSWYRTVVTKQGHILTETRRRRRASVEVICTENVPCMYKGVLFSLEQGAPAVCDSIGEPAGR